MSPAAKPSPQQRFAQQLRKGALEMLVLQRLARAPAHGYAIIQQLRTASGGLLDLKEGTLYPILYRLEDGGVHCFSLEKPGRNRHAGNAAQSLHHHRSRPRRPGRRESRLAGICRLRKPDL